MVKKDNEKHHKKQKKPHRITNEEILDNMNYSFSRDAEWFKRTVEKIEKVKGDLDMKFYNEEKKRQKIDFIRKLKNKLKDYKDALQFEGKYKMVKFFERRKLERMLKKINKEIKLEEEVDPKNPEKMTELSKKKEKIVDDINYVKVTTFIT